jgi:hypothetical protein
MELTREEQITESARKVRGEDNMLVELALAEIRKRAVEPVLRCRICGFEWDPAGLSDPIASPIRENGSLCAQAEYFAEIGIEVPRALLLDCAECLQDPEEYACCRGKCPPDCPLCS